MEGFKSIGILYIAGGRTHFSRFYKFHNKMVESINKELNQTLNKGYKGRGTYLGISAISRLACFFKARISRILICGLSPFKVESLQIR